VALENGISRQEQDDWALRSHSLWKNAQEKGFFNDEIIPVKVSPENVFFLKDEHPRPNASLEKLSALKPVYGSPTVTAGNASGICDGAAVVFLMTRQEATDRQLPVIGAIRGWVSISGEPRQTPRLPAVAINLALSKAGMTLDKMDVIEVNEAFAAMPLVSSLVLASFETNEVINLRKRINVNGGAIAIGHPIGATGARLLMTVAYELQRRGGGYGIVAICGAIGQTDAMILEVSE
jgi:acetyl-CoA C-acetyltransferase